MFLIKDYIDFISENKTEREVHDYVEKALQSLKFEKYNDMLRPTHGAKIYMTKMGKAIAAFKLVDTDNGDPISDGLNILCAHIDSPRLDIKSNPLMDEGGLTYLNTHYYGGIKKYQWVTLPLALHGVVCKKDGTKININIGEAKEDPVFYISDLLPHLAQDQYDKSARDFISGEELDIIIGNTIIWDEKSDTKPKDAVMKVIAEKYGFEESDFMSAEIEAVPAGPARYVGFDKNLIAGYGHDDRCCAFASLKSFLDFTPVKRSTCLLLVDKEEIGSYGATGFDSNILENFVSDLAYILNLKDFNARKCLENSNMLSSDVNAAFDPHHADLFDKDNTCFLGKGVSFNKFTGSRGKSGASDANPEFIAAIRSVLDVCDTPYQFAELGKVDKGGGGTIALYAARYGMNVLDVGLPVLSMHAPWELIDKRDMESAYDVYKNFLTLEKINY